MLSDRGFLVKRGPSPAAKSFGVPRPVMVMCTSFMIDCRDRISIEIERDRDTTSADRISIEEGLPGPGVNPVRFSQHSGPDHQSV